MKLNEKQVELLKKVDAMLNQSAEMCTDLVYRTAAQSMRHAADEIDKEEAIKKEFTELVKELS